MAVYEASRHGPEVVHSFTGNREWVMRLWKRSFWFPKKVNVALSSTWTRPYQGGCSQFLRLCSSGSSPAHHRPAFEAHPGANTFPSVCGLTTSSFTDPSASRNTFSVSTITDGNARGGGRSHLLAWLYIEPFPCGGVRPAGDPVDSDPGAVFEDDPHSRSDAVRPLDLECVTTPGSRPSCPGWAAAHSTWMLTVFTSLACSPGRTSRVGEDCRPRTTWRPLTLAGSPTLPPLRLTGGFCHAD